jgi:hypothetical protein
VFSQHLKSPHGGLQGFAFDPLRNAIVTADHLEMFLETWDDPVRKCFRRFLCRKFRMANDHLPRQASEQAYSRKR